MRSNNSFKQKEVKTLIATKKMSFCGFWSLKSGEKILLIVLLAVFLRVGNLLILMLLDGFMLLE